MQTWRDGRKNKRKRVAKGKSAIGSLAKVIKGRNVSTEVKRCLRNSILLPTLMYGSETWKSNKGIAVKSVCCGNELSERGMWKNKTGR